MQTQSTLLLGKGVAPVYLHLKYANRHGLIAGATGTGKTVTLQIMAEQFSQIGVPVFMADIKGDLAGISTAGEEKPFLSRRAQDIDLHPYTLQGSPTIFWDLYGEQGHPIRTTLLAFGPVLLAQLLELNETQSDVLQVVFKAAEDRDLLLLDLLDLQAAIKYVESDRKALSSQYGNISSSSLTAILRKVFVLQEHGGDQLFGEPAFEIKDFMRQSYNGQGFVNLLAANQLMLQPKLYAMFLLWLLTELFKEMPEVGDQSKPKLVFFFDEAHLLFDQAPTILLERIEQVVRLIRSKGIGIYFVTQNPKDIPDDVLGQLGNRIQHALRAYTPKDRKGLLAAAQSFRENPAFDAAEVITELGIGEALVSTLDERGIPSVVERTLIRPPSSRLGQITGDERKHLMQYSPVNGKYETQLDRESAHEILKNQAETKPVDSTADILSETNPVKDRVTKPRGRPRQGLLETMAKSVVRSVGSSMGRRIARSLMGSLFKSGK